LGGTKPSKTVTLGATPVAVNDTSVTVVATTFDIYEGTRLFFEAGKVLYVSEFAASGATTLKVEAATAIITAADVATLYNWIPYFSAKTFSYTTAKEEIKDNVYADGGYPEKALIGLDVSATMNGPLVHNDPGMTQVFAAQAALNLLNFQILYPNQRGGYNFDAYVSVAENNDRAAFTQRTCELTVTGGITYFSDTV
jgi:hypothetical protein